jgi:hypothetical protein
MPVPNNGVDTRRAYAIPVFAVRGTLTLNCDPDTARDFYPERGEVPKDARAACALCQARAECASWAVRTTQAHGVWGGLGTADRHKLIRRFGNDPNRAADAVWRALATDSAWSGALLDELDGTAA